MKDVLIIGVAGGSGSGKSTLIEKIREQFGNRVTVMNHDNYYRRQTEPSYEVRAKVNYDCPDAFETDLMAKHLKMLRAGQEIDCPIYDYAIHNRSDRVLRVKPADVILIDGILILAEPALRKLMDIKIFVDTPDDVRILRRIRRDVKERARSLDSVIDQYLTTVRPMHELYVAPSKKYADLIVPEGGMNRVALDMILERIRRHLE